MSTCSECERLRRELADMTISRDGYAKQAMAREVEGRRKAFIEAAEIAGKLFTAEFTPQEPGFMRGVGYAAQTIFDDLRAKAEETGHE